MLSAHAREEKIRERPFMAVLPGSIPRGKNILISIFIPAKPKNCKFASQPEEENHANVSV